MSEPVDHLSLVRLPIMRFTLFVGVLLGIGGALLGACDVIGASEWTEQLREHTWQLTALRTADERYAPEDLVGREVDNRTYVLRFSRDGKLEGSADCNAYGGKYVADEDGLFSVRELISTEVYCGEGSREGLYLEGLREADEYEVEEGRLRLLSEEGSVLVFENR